MAKAHAGMFPGAYISPLESITMRDNGRAKSIKTPEGLQYDPFQGFRLSKKQGWKRPEKQVVIKELWDNNGGKHKVKYYAGASDYIAFYAHTTDNTDETNSQADDDVYTSMINFADSALKGPCDGFNADAANVNTKSLTNYNPFDDDDDNIPETTTISSYGPNHHIRKIRYAASAQVLEVTFKDATVCVFFRVPSEIAGHLIYLLKQGTCRGDGRSLVGVEFWDLVRIRGSRYGARFPFEYMQHGNRAVYNKHEKRHFITIGGNDNNFSKEAIVGLLANRKQPYLMEHFKAGTPISIVVDEDEMAELEKASHDWDILSKDTRNLGKVAEIAVSKLNNDDQLAAISDKSALLASNVIYNDIDINSDVADIMREEMSRDEAHELGRASSANSIPGRHTPTKRETEWMQQVDNALNEKIKEYNNRTTRKIKIDRNQQLSNYDWKVLINEYPMLMDAIEYNDGYIRVREPNSRAELNKLINAANSVRRAGVSPFSIKSEYAAANKGIYTGVGWTPEQIEATVKNLPSGNIKLTCSAFIASGDYTMALNQLKHTLDKSKVDKANGVTGKNIYNMQTFIAGQNDFVYIKEE